MRIAIIGGTFDPIHEGHLAMAKHVLKHHTIDEVWFMVAKDTPLKERKLTTYEVRCQLCYMAIKPYKNMRICTLENELAQTSYTIHTVKELYKRYQNHQFVWLIGADQAAQLQRWKNVEELVELIDFYVFPRNQQTITCTYPYTAMRMDLIEVSSSEIRRGKKRYMMPRFVRRYMDEQHLYLEEQVRSHMSEKRFLHSKGVAQLCVEIANAHGMDTQQAYLAGILHDVCKEWSIPQLEAYMKQFDPTLLEEPKAIWHGYVAAHAIGRSFGIYDKQIKNAIYHHVQGKSTQPLAMVVYVSDKLDPTRGYDSTSEIALCKQDLEKGFLLVHEQQDAYLKKEKTIVNGERTTSDRTSDR